MTPLQNTRFGTVAVVGRPNVGKSTLVNAIVGEHLCAVTPKAQTTRHRILGLRVVGATQIALVDTPGLHSGQKNVLNRMMNRAAAASLEGVDLALLLIEAGREQEDDRLAADRVQQAGVPYALVINKIDRIKRREVLLPFIEQQMQRLGTPRAPEFVMPLSALKKDNLLTLLNEIAARMPEGPFHYGADEMTDRSSRFLAAEIVREQATLRLREELPYALAVDIESYTESEGRIDIGATIWVARESQKGIVIGKGGAMLKEIGTAARLELKRLLGEPVHLKLWCRHRSGWADDEKALRSLGYESDS